MNQVNPESLEGLISWLETQPKETGYSSVDVNNCVLGQYTRAMELRRLESTNYKICGSRERFWNIALYKPHTFGAALKRAKRELRWSKRKLFWARFWPF